jgi:hypothetical protein
MRTNYALQLSQIKSEYLFNNFDLKKNKNHRTTDPLNPEQTKTHYSSGHLKDS